MTALITTLRDDCLPEARSFAEHRGFVLRQHWVYWQLPLLSFDEAPFLPLIECVQAQHIRFFSFADTGNTAETRHKLYHLNRRTSLDAPGEDSFPTFDAFVEDIIQADWFRPDSQLIAADGDDWVGLVAIGLDGQRAFNAFTGVEQTHRRRGIALALTLLGIRYARQHNATYLEVMNDSRNVPMLALQEQLGYQRTVGRCILEQAFV
jgi:RimJ/RimL family protein N-acetyltransferase